MSIFFWDGLQHIGTARECTGSPRANREGPRGLPASDIERIRGANHDFSGVPRQFRQFSGSFLLNSKPFRMTMTVGSNLSG
jgi:hypothetical protein